MKSSKKDGSGRRRSSGASVPGGVGVLVSAFESETAAVFLRTSPAREHRVLHVIALMLIVFVGLASVVKLDRVVTGTGRVVSVGGQIYLSPLDRALVREIRVKAGDVVKKGQVLATLDSTLSGASLAQLEQKRASDEAEIARHEAELADRPYAGGSSPNEVLQASIWRQRQAEYSATLTDYDARSRSAEASIAQFSRDAQDFDKRLALAADVEKMNLEMQAGGYVTRAGAMAATDTRVELSRLLSNARNQLASSQQSLAALKAQRAAYIQKWHADVGSRLVELRNDLNQVNEELKKARLMNEADTLDAPSDAVVLKIARISTGSVTSASTDQAREPLFTLVPLDVALEAEIAVAAADIGFIAPDDTVQIKLDAYRYLRHGTAKGVVKTISEGSFTTNDDGAVTDPYFRVRIAFTDINLHNVPDSFRLIPGMTLAGDILVGRRTILSYLTEGALRTGSEAMREP